MLNPWVTALVVIQISMPKRALGETGVPRWIGGVPCETEFVVTAGQHQTQGAAPGVVVGSLAGAWLADITPGAVLYLAFIAFLFAISLQMALARVSAHRALPSTGVLVGTATLVGGVSALMGIGGGAMHVPFLSYCGVPVKRAIATAAAIGLPLAASATLGYLLGGMDEAGRPPGSIGYVNLPVFAGVVAASLVFAPLGASLAHRLPDLLLRRLFAGFLFILAARMAYNLL